jgi:hypothetical protein
MTADDARSRFERALVATLYCVGTRGEALALGDLGPEAMALVRTLSSTDKQTRALGLAREIARIGLELDRGALG